LPSPLDSGFVFLESVSHLVGYQALEYDPKKEDETKEELEEY